MSDAPDLTIHVPAGAPAPGLLRAGDALVIPLAGLPAGTQIAIQIVVGPPEPPAAPETPPAAPAERPRYLGGR